MRPFLRLVQLILWARAIKAAADTTPNVTTVNYCDSEDFISATSDYDNFDWTLIQRVAEYTEENFLITPLGLKLPLTFLMEAATGSTQQELSSLLGLAVDKEIIRTKFTSAISSLQAKAPTYIVNAGNRIYVDNSRLRQRFAAIAEQFYMTEIRTADFNNPLKEINGWVSNITEGRLPNLTDEVLILIVNTLYFKGSWKYPFNVTSTRVMPFFLSRATIKNAPFMNLKAKLFYAESSKLDVKILRIPYLGNEFAMYIVVPNDVGGLPHVFNYVNELHQGMNYLQEQTVDVSLPKFNLGITSQLDGILKELGLREIFTETASIPGIATPQSSQRLRLSKVLQRAGIEVNEFGTVLCTTNAPETEEDIQDVIIVNKPFLFFVQDEVTRQLLLVGRVTDPTL